MSEVHPRFPKQIQDQLDKIQGKKKMNTIVAYGHLGAMQCYLNVSVEEAHLRYCSYIEGLNKDGNGNQLHVPTMNTFTRDMKHFTFEDEFRVYDIEAPDE